MLAAFSEISGALDNFRSDTLLDKLASIGSSKKIIIFIKFLTYQRYIHTNSLKNSFRVSGKGVSQGGVLSPLLYIIYVKDITDNVCKHVKISQFAEAVAVYSKFFSVKKCKSTLGNAKQTIKKNLSDLGLDLSP